jgi:hypothetical protein
MIKYEDHSLQHCTFMEIRSRKEYFGINFKGLTILSAIRHPYERMISNLFFYRLISESSTEDEVEEASRKFLSEPPAKYDNHPLPQYLYLINENGDIPKRIKIIRNEKLNRQMHDLGYTDFDIHIQKNPKTLDYFEYFNQNTIQMINEHYKKDFEYFGYTTLNME